jgi:hypothetical protein
MTNAGSPQQDWRQLYSGAILKVDHARRMPCVSAARLAICGHIEVTLGKRECRDIRKCTMPSIVCGSLMDGLGVLRFARPLPGARAGSATTRCERIYRGHCRSVASKIPPNAKRAES